MANLKTAISFGLVHIPVVLNPVIKNNDTSFNFLHKKCGSRVKYVKYCEKCNKEVKNTDLIKGYQYQKDEYVTFDDEDFEKLKAQNDRIIDIISFVDLKEIDPVYFEKSYYLKTEKQNKAFALFRKALAETKKVALAKTMLGNKSYFVILRFGQDNIILNTLYYEEEVRLNEEEVVEEFNEKEYDLAVKLIESMDGAFEPEKYKDEYQDSIKEAIEQKINGQEIKPVKKKKTRSINDLMEALEKSIKQKKTA